MQRGVHGQGQRLLHERGHGLAGAQHHGVPHVHDAGDAVVGAVGRTHQDAQVARGHRGGLDVLGGGVRRHGHEVPRRRDQVPHRGVLQVQGTGDLAVGLLVQRAGGGGVLHELPDGVGVVPAHGRSVRGGHAAGGHQPVGHGVGEGQQGTHRPHVGTGRARHGLGRELGVGDGPGLRRHLPHHQVQEGHQQQGQEERGRPGDGGRQAPAGEHRSQPRVHRGLGDGAEREGGERDAQLRTGQHDGQLVHAAQGGAGRAARAGLGLQPVAACGEQGELHDHEEGAEHDQRDRGEDDEHGALGHRGSSSVSSSRGVSTRCTSTSAGTCRSTRRTSTSRRRS